MQCYRNSAIFIVLILLATGCGDVHNKHVPKIAQPEPSSESQSLPQQFLSLSSDPLQRDREDTLSFHIHSTLPKMILRVNRRGKEVRSLDILVTAHPNERLQRLKVGKTHIRYNRDLSVYVQVVDLNFDGYKDIGFMTVQGVVNFQFDYWIYDERKREFESIGRYPLLEPNRKSKQLTTFLRGGHYGLLHESRVYEFRGDTLTLVQRTKQTFLRENGDERLYLRTTGERRGDTLRVVTQVIVSVRTTQEGTRLDTLRPDSLAP